MVEKNDRAWYGAGNWGGKKSGEPPVKVLIGSSWRGAGFERCVVKV